MSIWGYLPEENDDASDWLNEFIDSPSIIALNDAFDDLLFEKHEYKEITECANAYLAAAITEEIFSKNQRILKALPEYEINFINKLFNNLHPGAKISLIRRAIESLDFIKSDRSKSELLDIIHESIPLFRKWEKEIELIYRKLLYRGNQINY